MILSYSPPSPLQPVPVSHTPAQHTLSPASSRPEVCVVSCTQWLCVCVCMHACMRVCGCMCACAFCECVRVCVYLCICICVCTWFYTVFFCVEGFIFQHVIMYYMYSIVYTGIVISSHAESMIYTQIWTHAG